MVEVEILRPTRNYDRMSTDPAEITFRGHRQIAQQTITVPSLEGETRIKLPNVECTLTFFFKPGQQRRVRVYPDSSTRSEVQFEVTYVTPGRDAPAALPEFIHFFDKPDLYLAFSAHPSDYGAVMINLGIWERIQD